MSMKLLVVLVVVILISNLGLVYAEQTIKGKKATDMINSFKSKKFTSDQRLLVEAQDQTKSKYYVYVSGGKYSLDLVSGRYEMKSLSGQGPELSPFKCDYNFIVWVNDAKSGTLIEVYKNGLRLDGERIGTSSNSGILQGNC
jgi:hypothetical protein